MTSISVGDLATTFQSRQNNSRIKADLQRIATELATGVKENLRAATGGDLGALAGLEHGLGTLQAYRIAAAESALSVGSLQRVLDTVRETSSEAGAALLQASSTGQPTLVQVAASDARTRFSSVVSALNTKVADRALLGGTGTDGAALASAEDMLANLQAAISGETTATGVEAAVEAWFDTPGGGFETDGYLASTTDLAPYRIGPNEEAVMTLRADDQVLRDVLKSYAMAALVADDALSGDQPERAKLLETAALKMLTADKPLAELQAGVGTVEAQIDNATARNSAETSALEIARSELIAIDPYKSATDLASVQTQLETLYAITARLSRLSLADYLR